MSGVLAITPAAIRSVTGRRPILWDIVDRHCLDLARRHDHGVHIPFLLLYIRRRSDSHRTDDLDAAIVILLSVS